MTFWPEPQSFKCFSPLLIPQDTNDEDVALFDAEEDAGKRSKAKIKYVNRWLLCDPKCTGELIGFFVFLHFVTTKSFRKMNKTILFYSPPDAVVLTCCIVSTGIQWLLSSTSSLESVPSSPTCFVRGLIKASSPTWSPSSCCSPVTFGQ